MLERIRELQAVPGQSIHAAVRDEDGPGRGERHAADGETQPRNGHTGRQVVENVVDDRPDARTAQVADGRDVGEQQEERERPPRQAEEQEPGEAGGERRGALGAQPWSDPGRVGRRGSVSGGISGRATRAGA